MIFLLGKEPIIQRLSESTRRKVATEHIRDGRTIQSLDVEYGVSSATISNWVRTYREECQSNDEGKSQLELMEGIRRLRQEKSELEKENNFLKKEAGLSQRACT